MNFGEGLQSAPDEALHGVGLGNIHLDGDRRSVTGFDLRYGFIGGGAVDVGNHNSRPFLGEFSGTRPANSRAGPCDHHDAILKLQERSVCMPLVADGLAEPGLVSFDCSAV